MNELWKRRPSPAMVVAVIALVVALAGTAYAAQQINGNLIQKQSIGGGKLKKKTLTGFQVNTNKLGTVPLAKVATHTFWVVVHNPASPGNAVLARASGPGTATPNAGYAQTNGSPASANAIEVRTKDKDGGNEDSDFHLIVVCP
jgi:hypothetical protein